LNEVSFSTRVATNESPQPVSSDDPQPSGLPITNDSVSGPELVYKGTSQSGYPALAVALAQIGNSPIASGTITDWLDLRYSTSSVIPTNAKWESLPVATILYPPQQYPDVLWGMLHDDQFIYVDIEPPPATFSFLFGRFRLSSGAESNFSAPVELP